MWMPRVSIYSIHQRSSLSQPLSLACEVLVVVLPPLDDSSLPVSLPAMLHRVFCPELAQRHRWFHFSIPTSHHSSIRPCTTTTGIWLSCKSNLSLCLHNKVLICPQKGIFECCLRIREKSLLPSSIWMNMSSSIDGSINSTMSIIHTKESTFRFSLKNGDNNSQRLLLVTVQFHAYDQRFSYSFLKLHQTSC